MRIIISLMTGLSLSIGKTKKWSEEFLYRQLFKSYLFSKRTAGTRCCNYSRASLSVVRSSDLLVVNESKYQVKSWVNGEFKAYFNLLKYRNSLLVWLSYRLCLMQPTEKPQWQLIFEFVNSFNLNDKSKRVNNRNRINLVPKSSTT